MKISYIKDEMLKRLHLHNFRNHTDKPLEFSAEKIVFFGQNGRGKTNILEAISVLSVGKSWRETKGEDLIEDGHESALIEAQIEDKQYKFLIQPRSRSIQRNDKKIPLKNHLGAFPTLLFAPEHLGIFSGTKALRQQFFDRFLSQIHPVYRDTLSRAKKASSQKNALLRRQSDDFIVRPEDLKPWNTILIETIPQIWKMRTEFLTDIQPLLQTELKKISENSDPIEIELRSPESFEPTEAGVKAFFEAQEQRELAARKNLLAPSRDDFVFLFRGKPILTTASRGEERSVLLALLSAKKQFLKKIRGIFPILLLDDSFSELDNDRQRHLEQICDGAQVFFTTTHAEHFEEFNGEVQRFEIK